MYALLKLGYRIQDTGTGSGFCIESSRGGFGAAIQERERERDKRLRIAKRESEKEKDMGMVILMNERRNKRMNKQINK